MAWSDCRLNLSYLWLVEPEIILSIVYINSKLIYASETLACTIRECEIVRNVLHVTLTCTFISWCSRATNFNWTQQYWHSYFNSLKLNCFPRSAEIPSKSHHPNLSIYKSGLEHIQLIHHFLCGKFLHTINSWNFRLGINN